MLINDAKNVNKDSPIYTYVNTDFLNYQKSSMYYAQFDNE